MSPGTVMMVMTGMADIRYRSRALGQGVLYCIEKPVDLHKLLVWIESGLRCQALAAARHRHNQPTSSAFRTHWLKAS
jgi:FixJ family two-component response regulator